MPKSGHCRSICAFQFKPSPFLYFHWSYLNLVEWNLTKNCFQASSVSLGNVADTREGDRDWNKYWVAFPSYSPSVSTTFWSYLSAFQSVSTKFIKCPWNNIWKADDDQQCFTLWISLLKLLKAVSTTLLFYSLAFLWCLLQLSPAAELGWASGPLLGWRNPEGTYSTDSSQIHRRKKSLLEKEAAGRSQRRWDKNSHVLCYAAYPVQPFKIK